MTTKPLARTSGFLAILLGLATAQPLLALEPFGLPDGSPFNGFTAEIPTRDGKRLAADCYVPKAGGRYPVILIQTPYNKNTMRVSAFGMGNSGRALFSDPNYAFVVTDWRGTAGSRAARSPRDLRLPL